MAFNISRFKQQGLVYGGARASLFEFILSVPTVLSTKAAVPLRFTCRASSIPASTVGQIEVPYFGRKIKLSGDRTFADWSITVMNDEDYLVRKMFEEWLFVLNSHEENKRSSNFNDYKAFDSTVIHYGKDGEPINLYNFVGLFPTEVSAMELDWDNTNSIQTFSVNLAYDYWTSTVKSPIIR